MEPTQTAAPDSSSATAAADSSPALEVPRDSAAYAKWRTTGELPDSKPAKTETKSPASKEGTSAPASEAGKSHQEQKPPKRDNANDRLRELLDDIKATGYTPAELKALRKQATQADTSAPQETKPQATEQTANPELKAPVKPDIKDFKTYEEYEAAKDDYVDKLSDYKSKKAVQDYANEQQQKAHQQTVNQKMEEAATRYGKEGGQIIAHAGPAIAKDAHPAVYQMIDRSDVWPDLVYTLGQKPEDLAAFIALSKSDPMNALRKVVLMEQLIKDELKAGKAGGDSDGDGARDDSGKFIKKTPDKPQSSAAPPPPKELSGRGSNPPDEVERAVKDGDFKALRSAENRSDLNKRRGR